MNKRDESQSQIHNQGPIQGLNNGYNQYITQYFYGNTNGEATHTSQPERIWLIPYRRNPFFTGRETILAQLREHFIMNTSVSSAQGLAINGLGGIGKTQLALEYAYRYRSTYSSTLWVSASSHEALLSDFMGIANHLELPECSAPEQNTIVTSVRLWLENNKDWLLIIDNIEELNLLESFLPTKNTGHILLTTRAQATGEFESFSLEQMDSTESTDLLLRRVRMTTSHISREHFSHTDQTLAMQIAQEMHGLPLALDQAGAYIEETACSLSEYLALYQNQRKTLLAERGSNASHHSESVAATFLLSLQKIEATHPLAADVLRACTFLDPDAIPEEIITEVTSELRQRFESARSNSHLFLDAIKQLRRFSLLHRNPSTKMLSLHRLLQAVIRDDMEVDTQHQWVVRTIQVVNATFPSVIDVTTWAQCERYLAQALACVPLMETYSISSLEAARLLLQIAQYFDARGRYKEEEPLFHRAKAMHIEVLGREHFETAKCCNDLANLYYRQGKYEEAEKLLQFAISIYKRDVGPDHLATATPLSNLGMVSIQQGKYEQAETLLEHPLRILTNMPQQNYPEIAKLLNNFAGLYSQQSRYEDAIPLLQHAVAISEKVQGTEHPDTARNLNNLAALYLNVGQYEDAVQLWHRALAIRENVLGLEHPDTEMTLNNLVNLLLRQGKHEYVMILSLRRDIMKKQMK